MDNVPTLGADELERFVFTLESSLRINRRYQFYLWAQGSLQIFLPHETLVCVRGDLESMDYHHECFSRDVLPPAVERALCDPGFGLLPGMVSAWLHGGREPRAWGEDPGEVSRRGFSNVLAHGAREMHGDNGTFFAFMRSPAPPGPREAYLVDLLMPYLHMAFCRMLASEAADNGAEAEATEQGIVLSHREIEVLHWVRDGKTNPEIGQILSISPLTVKNHVQKILRKLNVSNRAQAVGKGVSCRLFSSSARPGRNGA